MAAVASATRGDRRRPLRLRAAYTSDGDRIACVPWRLFCVNGSRGSSGACGRCSSGWITGWIAGWFVGWFVGWLVGWFVGWLVGWFVGWFAG
jgi:hypothetical protein